ncbi:MAG: hypothetical protein LUQ71_07665 [Methanoregula sp.]|nr:hypothetical protein [Methanoregula sp.]
MHLPALKWLFVIMALILMGIVGISGIPVLGEHSVSNYYSIPAGVYVSFSGSVPAQPVTDAANIPDSGTLEIPVHLDATVFRFPVQSVAERFVQPTIPYPDTIGRWIAVDPVEDHYVGDIFIISGTTNLRAGENITVMVDWIPRCFGRWMPPVWTQLSVTRVQNGKNRVLNGKDANNTFSVPVDFTPVVVDGELQTICHSYSVTAVPASGPDTLSGGGVTGYAEFDSLGTNPEYARHDTFY